MVLQVFVVADTRKGQEGRPARLFTFQDFDQPPGRILIPGDNILNAAPERDFDGRLVFFLGRDQIGNRADDPLFPGPLLHDAPDAAAEALVALREIGDRVQL